jgi:hypothetical protein
MIAARCRAHAPGVDLAGRVSEVLAAEVRERLARLDRIAAGEPRSQADMARIRAGMREALGAWRRLLEQHRADERDRCPKCRSWCGLRRAKAPCRVWLTAHNHLITDLAARPR